MFERHNQNMDFLNEKLQSSVADENAGGEFQAQQGSHRASVNYNQLETPGEIRLSESLIGQISLPHDYDWYSLSFAEAGVEQFAGLEPSTLFQQGWRTFG
jgi:hypothetical protein